ncbi:MAG TPA: hypothetical protein VJN63_08255 [Thermoplasmata archaeon]|nr:hypothetical protein [Thermoplasmata archaeon]
MVELDPLIVLAVVGYLTLSSVLITGVWLSRREIRKIRAKADPILDSLPAILAKLPDLSKLADLEMIPGTIVAGIEKVLTDQLATQGSPLRQYTAALVTEGSSAMKEALVEVLGPQLETLKRLAPAAMTVLGEKGVESRIDKKEGVEAVDQILASFGPFRGLVEKFIPPSGRQTPADLLQNLFKAKQTISMFSPDLGARLDAMIEQAILGGGVPAIAAPQPGLTGLAGILGGPKLLPGVRAEGSSAVEAYGR